MKSSFKERPEGGFRKEQKEFEQYQWTDEILIVDERNRILIEI